MRMNGFQELARSRESGQSTGTSNNRQNTTANENELSGIEGFANRPSTGDRLLNQRNPAYYPDDPQPAPVTYTDSTAMNDSPLYSSLESAQPSAYRMTGTELAPGPFVEANQSPELLFDGERVVAFNPGSGRIVGEWDAVSGILEEGKTDPDRVQEENRGPIPEGDFTVDPEDSDENKWYKYRWGSEDSWGNVRTEIKPADGTDTHGRDGMYMHGGNDPGSAGCVDLTGDNNDFHDWLAEQDGPVDLTVDYTNFEENSDLDIDSGLRIVQGPDGTERVVDITDTETIFA